MYNQKIFEKAVEIIDESRTDRPAGDNCGSFQGEVILPIEGYQHRDQLELDGFIRIKGDPNYNLECITARDFIRAMAERLGVSIKFEIK